MNLERMGKQRDNCEKNHRKHQRRLDRKAGAVSPFPIPFLYEKKSQIPPGSKNGKRLAENIHRTFERKYDKHQPNRGFRGTVSERKLYVLANSNPPAAFLELGNLQNARDRKRLVLASNRQALADWICEGVVKDFKNN